jgi:hypothetical protein
MSRLKDGLWKTQKAAREEKQDEGNEGRLLVAPSRMGGRRSRFDRRGGHGITQEKH